MREVELDAGKLVLQLRQQLPGELFLVMGTRALADRLERREEFGVEQARGIGAVVGTAVLRHHRFHLGPRADDLAHLVDIGIALLQRDGRRQRGADPEVALFQLGQEFEAQQPREHDGHDHERRRTRHHDLAVGDRPVQHRHLDAVEQFHDPRLGFMDMHR